MTEPKFTPGPWKIERKRDRFITAIGPLCAEEYAGSAWLDVTDEDAHLIATAPKLYRELARVDPDNPVLAKARGGL